MLFRYQFSLTRSRNGLSVSFALSKSFSCMKQQKKTSTNAIPRWRHTASNCDSGVEWGIGSVHCGFIYCVPNSTVTAGRELSHTGLSSTVLCFHPSHRYQPDVSDWLQSSVSLQAHGIFWQDRQTVRWGSLKMTRMNKQMLWSCNSYGN